MAQSVRTRWRISLGVAALFSLCAAACFAAGIKGYLLGAVVDPSFRLSVTTGSFYSGGLASLAGPALLCCLSTDACQRHRRRRRRREARELRRIGRGGQGDGEGGGSFLLGVLMVTMAVLAAFVGTVLDGEAFSKALGKYEQECTRGAWQRGCASLRRYATALVVSASLNGLQCLLGFVLLIATREYKIAEARRDDRGGGGGGGGGGNAAVEAESGGGGGGGGAGGSEGGGNSTIAAFPPFGFYANPAALGGGGGGRRGTDRDVALPGYAESCRRGGGGGGGGGGTDRGAQPYSAPPPAYSDIFPEK